MASTVGPARKSVSLSIDEAITKIKEAVELINLRGCVKDHERQRAEKAFAMLAQRLESSSGKTGGKTSARREDYLKFLRQVNKECGLQVVVASSIGIGQTAIASMKERIRLGLPLEIKKHERTLKSPILQRVVEEISLSDASIRNETSTQSHRSLSTEPDAPTSLEQLCSRQPKLPSIPLDMLGSHTSRVFELTIEDAQGIITSQEVQGRVLLMEPHGKQTLPFITVTITEELCGFFTAERNRVG